MKKWARVCSGCWGLPLPIVDAVLNHHAELPKKSASEGDTSIDLDVSVAVNIANRIANGEKPPGETMRLFGIESQTR